MVWYGITKVFNDPENFTEIFSFLQKTPFTIFFSVYQNHAEEMDSRL